MVIASVAVTSVVVCISVVAVVASTEVVGLTVGDSGITKNKIVSELTY